MKIPLSVGTVIELECTNYDNGMTYIDKFTVIRVCGTGGSGIVYEVKNSKNYRYLLKEFYPSKLGKDTEPIVRDRKNCICVKDAHEDEYYSELEKHIKTCEFINRFLDKYKDAEDNSVEQLAVCKGNNTVYIQMEHDNGTSYDKIEDENINFIFRIALAVADAVRDFHEAGYLVMDIKPANILVLKNGDSYRTDIVKLFDFDSIISIEDARCGCRTIPLTDSFKAPETSPISSYCVNERSDIYSIGAMVRKRLTMKEPCIIDATDWFAGKVDISEKFKGQTDGESMKMICEFLSRTMIVDQYKRYENINEVTEALRAIIEKTK